MAALSGATTGHPSSPLASLAYNPFCLYRALQLSVSPRGVVRSTARRGIAALWFPARWFLCVLNLRRTLCLCDEFQSTRNIWLRCDCSDFVIQALFGLSLPSDIKHVIKPSEVRSALQGTLRPVKM
ncbi:unnamed protein product [Fusarium fujikuroi]|nr:unnamed protein product [Fusarium fujikuroi]